MKKVIIMLLKTEVNLAAYSIASPIIRLKLLLKRNLEKWVYFAETSENINDTS